jgi:hypothetical protein
MGKGGGRRQSFQLRIARSASSFLRLLGIRWFTLLLDASHGGASGEALRELGKREKKEGGEREERLSLRTVTIDKASSSPPTASTPTRS